MFYNGSFNETERDNKKHQKKASLETKRMFFMAVVDGQAVEHPCFDLKDRQMCMRTHGFIGPALSKTDRLG